jgi:DNA polymerase III delta prime subunit
MKKIWVEKWRPRTVAEVIVGNERDRKKFDSFIAEQNIPNLLLSGGAGTGKTSMSKALVRDLNVDKNDVLKLNCSDEKIEAMRDKVKNFATTMAMGKFKIVQLEEFDYLGHEAQALLRDLIESTSSNCRFIATCNYINKVTPPLRSRFQEFTFMAPDRDEVLLKSAHILEAENIDFDIDDLDKVVSAGYPDFRKVLQLLEAGCINNKLNVTSNDNISDWKIELLQHLESGDISSARKSVCESANKDELQDIFRFLYDNLNKIKGLKRKDEAVVLIAEYQYKHAFVADWEINVAALFIEISNLM